MAIPTQATKNYLHKMFSSFHQRPIDFEIGPTCQFICIYKDGKRIPGFEFGIFRGETHRFNEYLATFKAE
jgi:hypothetical protein